MARRAIVSRAPTRIDLGGGWTDVARYALDAPGARARHARGRAAERLPQTSNIAFPGFEGQTLLMALDMAGVACSVGSACSSGSTELSPTLRAMGLPNDLVRSSLRFSVGATNTPEQIDEAVRRICDVCRELG